VPFFTDREIANTQTFQYFSFTTLTTLGYGDFTAAGSGGRAIAVMEALTGQVFLATLVARLVTAFRGTAGRASLAPARRRSPGTGRASGKAPSGIPARRRSPVARATTIAPRASPGRPGRRRGR
jgi:hypothetical protein